MKLKAVRLLVVEDDPTLGAIWADILGDVGADVVGPYPTVARALEEVGVRPPAVAMLDIHLQDGLSYPVAQALAERQVPFFFVSSCDPQDVPAEFQPRPYLRKPVAVRDVMATLRNLTNGR